MAKPKLNLRLSMIQNAEVKYNPRALRSPSST